MYCNIPLEEWMLRRALRNIPQAGLVVSSSAPSCDHGPPHSASAGRIGLKSLLHHAVCIATERE